MFTHSKLLMELYVFQPGGGGGGGRGRGGGGAHKIRLLRSTKAKLHQKTAYLSDPPAVGLISVAPSWLLGGGTSNSVR